MRWKGYSLALPIVIFAIATSRSYTQSIYDWEIQRTGDLGVVATAKGGGAFVALRKIAGSTSLKLFQLGQNGTIIWENQATAGDCHLKACVTTPEGGFLVAGAYRGDLNYGGKTITSFGWYNLFLLKTSAFGDLIWLKGFSSTGGMLPLSMAVDATTESLHLTGYFYTDAHFDGLTLSGTPDRSQLFVVKLTKDGGVVWAVAGDGDGRQEANCLTLDAGGNVYVGGSFSQTAAFGGATVRSAGREDAFFAKLSPIGTWEWALSAGSADVDLAKAVVTDSSGVPYFAGSYSHQIQMGKTNLSASVFQGNFLVKVSPSGAILEALNVGIGECDLKQLGIDAEDRLYVTGRITGEASLGGKQLAYGMFYGRYNSALEVDFAQELPWTEPQAIAVRDDGLSFVVSTSGLNELTIAQIPSLTPPLSISRGGTGIVVGWKAKPALYALQEKFLQTGGWTWVPTAPGVRGFENLVVLDASSQSRMYRLTRP
jgi:hypothetical protein